MGRKKDELPRQQWTAPSRFQGQWKLPELHVHKSLRGCKQFEGWLSPRCAVFPVTKRCAVGKVSDLSKFNGAIPFNRTLPIAAKTSFKVFTQRGAIKGNRGNLVSSVMCVFRRLTLKRTCLDHRQSPAATASPDTTTTTCGTRTSQRWGPRARWISAQLGKGAPQMETGARIGGLECPGWTRCTRPSVRSRSTTARLSGKEGIFRRTQGGCSCIGARVLACMPTSLGGLCVPVCLDYWVLPDQPRASVQLSSTFSRCSSLALIRLHEGRGCLGFAPMKMLVVVAFF